MESAPGVSDLIFDIGMHNASDTEFYLKKGFRVVSVEANPLLARSGEKRLAPYIATGKLTVLNVGIGQEEGVFPFYVNESNDEWSSFNQALGTRKGTKYHVEQIKCIKAAELFRKYGMPHFMKVDIEGLDWLPVAALHQFSNRPHYVSVEDNGFQSLLQLYGIGAKGFKFIDQVEKWKNKPPQPALEGKYVDVQFGATTSGLFGAELPGEWLKIDQAALFYLQNIRPPDTGLREHWWDIHAIFS